MPSFSKRSKERLATCDERLQELMNAVIEDYDITIICGHRGEAEQNEAYENKRSQLRFPQSKHNSYPSKAVDIGPWPLAWNDIAEFQRMGEIVKNKAAELGIDVEWGGDWDYFLDYPHFQVD